MCCASCGVDVFEHIHRLSLSYYAEHEAGDVMSRMTNDIDTIQQAMSFALVQRAERTLLIVWIACSMLRVSVPYALLSLAVVPFMILATCGSPTRRARPSARAAPRSAT